ncbi:MAG: response regulator [Bacteroidia bacterium]|nr:response regulator [Bacteroidia bacterium]
MKSTLWLIEDDPVWVELIQNRYGDKFHIRHFDTVEAAIAAAKEGPLPRYVLLDYHVGEAAGTLFLKALHKYERPDSPPYVIMLSGQEDIQTAVDTFAYGAYDYVVKGDQVWERLKIAFRNIHRQEALEKEVVELRLRIKRWQLLVLGVVLLALLVIIGVYINLCPETRLWKWDPLGIGQKPPCAPS